MAHCVISLSIYIVEVMIVRLFGATLVEVKLPSAPCGHTVIVTSDIRQILDVIRYTNAAVTSYHTEHMPLLTTHLQLVHATSSTVVEVRSRTGPSRSYPDLDAQRPFDSQGR
jgi:hypothetical protein